MFARLIDKLALRGVERSSKYTEDQRREMREIMEARRILWKRACEIIESPWRILRSVLRNKKYTEDQKREIREIMEERRMLWKRAVEIIESPW